MNLAEYHLRGASHRPQVRAAFSLGSGRVSDEYSPAERGGVGLINSAISQFAHSDELHNAPRYVLVLSGLASAESAAVRYERHVRCEPVGAATFFPWLWAAYSAEETLGVNTSYVSRAEKVLNHLYLLVAKDRQQQALEIAFEFIESEFAADNIDSVDEALRKLAVKRVPIPLLVGVLRATSRARDVLPSWVQLLSDAKVYIDAIQMDSKRALRGLLPRSR